MIPAERERSALKAINYVLAVARNLAHEGRSADLTEVLDVAEYLPALMLEKGDRTSDFRLQLEELGKRFPEFAAAVQFFDRPA